MIKKILLLLSSFTLEYHSVAQVIQIISPYERGAMVDGVPKGKWEFSDKGEEVNFTLNYDSGQAIFNKPDTSKFLIQMEDGSWEFHKLHTPTRLLGSSWRLMEYYFQSIPYSIFPNINKTVWLTFEVGTDGVARSPKVVGELASNKKTKIIDAFNSAPNYWIPGSYNEHRIKTRLCLAIVNCVRDCNKVDAQMIGSKEIGKPYGQIGFRKFDKIDSSSSRRFAMFYFNQDQTIWSDDDSRIFIKIKTSDGTYTNVINPSTRSIEKILFAKDNYRITCNSKDCSEILINYQSSFGKDLITKYSIARGTQLAIIGNKHDISPVPSPSNSTIAFTRREKGIQQLHLYHNELGIRDISSNFDGSEVRPLAWINEQELICSAGDDVVGLNQWEIFNVNTLKKRILPFKSVEFIALSPDHKKILAKEIGGHLKFATNLSVLDLETKEIKRISKSASSITTSGWLAGSNNIYYSIKEKTYSKSLDGREREINNLASPVISNRGDLLIFFNKSSGNICLSKIDGTDQSVLFQLSK